MLQNVKQTVDFSLLINLSKFNIIQCTSFGGYQINFCLSSEKLEKRSMVHSDNKLESMIKVERIVISAFDYNLSLRHAQ